ncbi:MAG: hypothetical protein ACK5N8_00070 [Alphaproteobacteria bacterium]
MSNKEDIKNFLRSNATKFMIGASLLAGSNAKAQHLENRQENNDFKRNKLEILKTNKQQDNKKTLILDLCAKGFYEEAYRIQSESDPEKYGYIKNVDYENEVKNIKEEIISDYQITEGIVDDEMSMKDIPVEFTLNFLKENPDKKNFLEKLDRKNEYLNIKNKDGKLESISETANKSFHNVTEEDYTAYAINALGYYKPSENSISLNKIRANKTMGLQDSTIQNINKHNNMIDSAKHEKNRGKINRILTHELEHQSQQGKGKCHF